ncbi:MAG: hypothetical protein ACE5OT_02835 [Candidatus Hadarchaeaceae archaeon]
MDFHPNIARCVGLWLAEGDTKTRGEITFTNNCVQLVKFFEETIQKIFSEEKLKSRIYVYSPKIERPDGSFLSKINLYIDTRARKPYYVYKISKRSLMKRWKELVNRCVLTKEMYPYILEGFFAGEGNIKFNRDSCSRMVRIAQGTRNKLLEIILKNLGIRNRFSSAERAYVITGRRNLSKLAELEIATLHPEKFKKFSEMLATYKQDHYPKYYFKKKIYAALKKPHTSRDLASMFNRSVAHVQETLKILKDVNKVQNYKIGGKVFWIRTDQDTIFISSVKREYLNLLKKLGPSTTVILARRRNVDWQSASRGLKRIEKLGLVERTLKGKWKICATNKNIITIGRGASPA